VWELYGDLIDLKRDEPLKALDVAEHARSRALLDSLSRTQANVTPLSGPDLYTWLPADVTALVYASLKDRLLIWAVTRDGATMTERPVSSDRLQAMVGAFVADMRAGRPPANARDLAHDVLPDQLSTEAGRRLVFLPDGPLYQLPFGLLPFGPDGKPLVVTSVVATAPSLTIMARAPRPATGTHQALLVGYGRARPGDNLEALPDVEGEIADLSRMYRDHTALSGSGASPTRILDAFSGADVIHFAGHAIADDAHPSESRLFVAPDATGRDALTPDAIAASHLRPGAVVVLSACDTASGRIVRGEGAMSLARPFLQAGASAVIASLWPVRDADARAVLADWHARATAGASPAQALAETQRHFLTAPQSSTAFAFVVIGTDTRASNLRGDH
jgi:CHAT domain-containing protein